TIELLRKNRWSVCHRLKSWWPQTLLASPPTPQPAARVGLATRLLSTVPPSIDVGPLKYTAIREIPSNRLLRIATPAAAPPKLPPAPISVLFDEPAVAASVKRRPSTETPAEPIRSASLAPVAVIVASATRLAFAAVRSDASLGSMPAFGPRSCSGL